MNPDDTALLDYLYTLFPVPNHDHFQFLPKEEQWRIIGHGDVMQVIQEYLEKKDDTKSWNNSFKT
jgi:hypothetical protein